LQYLQKNIKAHLRLFKSEGRLKSNQPFFNEKTRESLKESRGLVSCAIFLATKTQMVKSELIALMTGKQPHLPRQDIELAINCIIEHLAATVAKGERIEIRGFGGFSIIKRNERLVLIYVSE
jgi:hypothetical protein